LSFCDLFAFLCDLLISTERLCFFSIEMKIFSPHSMRRVRNNFRQIDKQFFCAFIFMLSCFDHFCCKCGCKLIIIKFYSHYGWLRSLVKYIEIKNYSSTKYQRSHLNSTFVVRMYKNFNGQNNFKIFTTNGEISSNF